MEEPVRGFNALGRGYPDISAAGSSYVVYIGGTILSVSGTSASCPVIAGMITLINSARLLAGKKPVGFINPTLYATSNLFAKDITSGKNNCAVGSSGPTCCTQGFYAKPGWDPATGLGSVNFESLKRVFLNIGLAEAPTSPTLSPLRLAQSSSLTPTKLPSNLFADINTSPPPTTSSSGTGNVASPPQANVLTSSPSGTSTSISSSSQENFGFFNIKRTTPPPTLSPTHSPTRDPTKSPTKHPTKLPTRYPTRSPKSVPHKTRKSVRTRSPTPVKSSASSDNSCAAY